MATAGSHRTSSRTIRKIEAPRPLKDSSLNELNSKSSYSPLALSSYSIDCGNLLCSSYYLYITHLQNLSGFLPYFIRITEETIGLFSQLLK